MIHDDKYCLVSHTGMSSVFRRIRMKQEYDGTTISNPAYSDTTDEKNIFCAAPRERTNSVDSGLPDATEAGHYVDVQDNDQYNELECDIDDEYNKINFKGTSIPFDENYGHINQRSCPGNEDYDHIKGMTEINVQTYSNVQQQGKKIKETDEICIGENADYGSTKQTSEDSSNTYDHLGQPDDSRTPMTDDQGTNYSHFTSTLNGTVGKEKPNHNYTASDNVSSSVKTKDDDNEMGHEYFVLEPNVDSQILSRESDDGDINGHPYFILEPEIQS